MAAEFYIVYIKRREAVTYDDVKKKMDLSRSWYRITDSIWILYTTSDAEKWYSRLAPLVKEDGYLFICKLDVAERQGWMSEKFWAWLSKLEGAQ